MKKIIIPVISFILGVSLCIVIYILLIKPPEISLGNKAVNYLYNFNGLYNLSDNDKLFKEISTSKVYKQLSPTGEYRAMNTYLKLGESCKVRILNEIYTKTGGYITYTLDCDRLSSGRIFIFSYKVEDNKISSVKEYEALPFKEEGDE